MNFKLSAFTFVSFCFAAIVSVPAAQAVSLTTIVEGISNARGVSFGPDGTLYVAEPGVGAMVLANLHPAPCFSQFVREILVLLLESKLTVQPIAYSLVFSL